MANNYFCIKSNYPFCVPTKTADGGVYYFVCLQRYMSHAEAEIHYRDLVENHDPTCNFDKWDGEDSFGRGWCFFNIQNVMSDDELEVIEHYAKRNVHLLEVKLRIPQKLWDMQYKGYFGKGFYWNREVSVPEAHLPFIPWHLAYEAALDGKSLDSYLSCWKKVSGLNHTTH